MTKKPNPVPAILVIFFFLFIPSIASAQRLPGRALGEVTEARARSVVGFLASDLLEGREAGTRGGMLAAEYIVSLLQEWGVEPFMESGYFQPFGIVRQGDKWVAGDEAGCEARRLRNILAVIPGKEPGVVVVGAHYDHLGVDTTLVGDQCYNGADDNASGVSAVLQVAKAIKAGGKQPRRTILFAFWDGEEMGLLGSRYFVRNCPFLSEVSAYMNFDMAGRGPVDNPRHLSYLYTAANPAFGSWLRDDMERYGFCFEPAYKASENLAGGSDNTPFAQNGIPIVWYHTEGHPDYHRPSDSADKVDYPKLTDITRAALLCVWRLANERKY